MHPQLQATYDRIVARDPGEKEFLQAVHEVLSSLDAVVDTHPDLISQLESLAEPERIVQFKVRWEDDNHVFHTNRGYRVQMNSAIGPYKGGLRFHPSVNLSILKFLAFEQILKNSLTTLPLGAGKGGADFNPKGKSDAEIRRFCQAFMLELQRHIGSETDIPAGDIGVGGREIGYMFGMYKKIRNEFVGTLTGKGIQYGGSLMRTEATGYGLVYFLKYMLAEAGDKVEGQTVVISGSGNVAQHAAEKVIQLGGKVVALSDSSGYIYDPNGIGQEKLDYVKRLKNVERGRISQYAQKYTGAEFVAAGDSARSIWAIPCTIALPCATQNELVEADAEALIRNGVIAVAEGANMPTTPSAMKRFAQAGIAFAPGKASNGGGVATSGLEMAQNASRLPWTADQVDRKLDEIMRSIHDACLRTAKEYSRPRDYVFGANVAGFLRVAGAMKAQGS
eukprot:CAMPEP_0198316774 /NCGR_PEP_ID=MMETSP1450-20131203/6542_1 /TAXON_ID=753684 ORGANISM="Madagascaria erythrocladiodes, Strain CCMP3234" /NCGR_SAMPLE_ID=MMETSP1450 /ASSEMBLY_ACC=CAM_ASM_001115 /LENGTH=448 /DNA_ID=CAMNT_0044019941 /DNA_START=142 /DNA_END=1488 /DNA_ORIENTATION=+